MTEAEVLDDLDPTATAVDPDDDTELILWTWGISGEPVTWADTTMQPAIAVIRQCNLGWSNVAAVQSVLDATWPDAGYDATKVCLSHPPTAAFVISEGHIDPEVDPDVDSYIDIIRVDLTDDEDLALPDTQITWDFGDGTDTQNDLHGYEHGYRSPGVYTVSCTIPVAGVIFTTSQEHTVGEEPPPPPPPPADPEPQDLPATPEAYTVDVVKTWVDANPHAAADVLLHERARGAAARTTLVTWLEGFIAEHDG